MQVVLKEPLKVRFGCLRTGEVFAFENRQRPLLRIHDGLLEFNPRLNTVHRYAQAICLDDARPLITFIEDDAMVYRIDGKFVEE